MYHIFQNKKIFSKVVLCILIFYASPVLIRYIWIRTDTSDLNFLIHLFHLILQNYVTSEMWKTIKVCRIRKSGKVSIISSYLAITMLCNFSKVLGVIFVGKIARSPKSAWLYEKWPSVSSLMSVLESLFQNVCTSEHCLMWST